MIRHMLLALSLYATLPTLLHAETDWFPSEERQAMAQNVAAKLKAIDTEGKLTSERALEAARVGIEGVASNLEALGANGVIRMAPTYAGINLPASGNKALDAIAAYQLCSLPMDAHYNDASPRENRYDERAWGLLMSMSIYIVSTYLRPAYLASGTTDAQAQALVHGEAMNSLKAEIRSSKDLLFSTQNHCSAPLIQLMKNGPN
ncbi:MAG: hypothetical protein ABFS39_19210 [Pseudomonadota bacterium]